MADILIATPMMPMIEQALAERHTLHKLAEAPDSQARSCQASLARSPALPPWARPMPH
jgi:hypothetical protein